MAGLESVRAATKGCNFELQLHKCVFHIPAWRGRPQDELPSEVSEMVSVVPYSASGRLLLGTETSEDVQMPLDVPRDGAAIPEPTERRKDVDLRLAAATVEMIALAPPVGAKQAAYRIARTVIAHSLGYDASVLPCSALLPHASDIDQAVLQVTAATIDTQLEDMCSDWRIQVSLPVRFAGMQLDLPSHTIPLARTVPIVEPGPSVRAAVAS